MYLYIYQRDSDALKVSDSRFSDRMVRSALDDFLNRKKIRISEETLNHLEIRRDEKGKPCFSCPMQKVSRLEAVHYSVSHSGTWWGCLMAEESVGFDMEAFRDRIHYMEIAKRFFTEEEYEYVTKTGLEGFFNIWVRKEAYIKFLGTGLAEGLGSFSVVRDMELSPVVIIDRAECYGPMPPLHHLVSCNIQEDVIAACCSSGGLPISQVIRMEDILLMNEKKR